MCIFTRQACLIIGRNSSATVLVFGLLFSVRLRAGGVLASVAGCGTCVSDAVAGNITADATNATGCFIVSDDIGIGT